MMERQDLNKAEQQVYDMLEGWFMKHKTISTKSFIKVLGTLINKLKRGI